MNRAGTLSVSILILLMLATQHTSQLLSSRQAKSSSCKSGKVQIHAFFFSLFCTEVLRAVLRTFGTMHSVLHIFFQDRYFWCAPEDPLLAVSLEIKFYESDLSRYICVGVFEV